MTQDKGSLVIQIDLCNIDRLHLLQEHDEVEFWKKIATSLSSMFTNTQLQMWQLSDKSQID
jgi:hypothetical protein